MHPPHLKKQKGREKWVWRGKRCIYSQFPFFQIKGVGERAKMPSSSPHTPILSNPNPKPSLCLPFSSPSPSLLYLFFIFYFLEFYEGVWPTNSENLSHCSAMSHPLNQVPINHIFSSSSFSAFFPYIFISFLYLSDTYQL